jgi:hypothetical protein
MYRDCCNRNKCIGHKTFAHALADYKILKNKKSNRLTCAQGTSVPYQKPKITVQKTICDNGSRVINAYYLNGVRVNALGFKLDKSNKKFIKNNKCKGCDSFRCTSYKYYTPSTAN